MAKLLATMLLAVSQLLQTSLMLLDSHTNPAASAVPTDSAVGLGTEFCSEKIPQNRLGTVSVIPRKKGLIPRHSKLRGRANSEALNGTEWNGIP